MKKQKTELADGSLLNMKYADIFMHSVLFLSGALEHTIRERYLIKTILSEKNIWSIDELMTRKTEMNFMDSITMLTIKLYAAKKDHDVYLKEDAEGNITHVSLFPFD